jgi:DNA polymerase III delta prime subunit
MQSFSAQNMRVDFRRFLFWAQKVRKWSMPERLSSFAQNIDIEALDENVEEKAGVLRDERNSLQLIWALRKLLKEHQYGKTDRELIYYLSKTYPDQKAFKRLSLEMKFAEAQVASEA